MTHPAVKSGLDNNRRFEGIVARFDRASTRYLSPSRGLCTGDFLRAVTNRPEDRVGFSVWRSTKEGIQIFPDNLSVSGDFEKASKGGFID